MKKNKNGEDEEDLRLTVVTTPPPFKKRPGVITTDSPKVKDLVENMDANIAENLRKERIQQADELRKMGVKVNEK